MTVGETIGDSSISAWLVAPGVCWIQTRSPRHARRLSQRSDTHVVVTGAGGGFLKTFEIDRPMSWAKAFIARHEPREEPIDRPFLSPGSPTSRRNCRKAVRGGLGKQPEQTGEENNN